MTHAAVHLVAEFKAIIREDLFGDAKDHAVVEQLLGDSGGLLVGDDAEREVLGESVDDDEDVA